MSCLVNLSATTKYFKHLNADCWPTNPAFNKIKNTTTYFLETTYIEGGKNLTKLFFVYKTHKAYKWYKTSHCRLLVFD